MPATLPDPDLVIARLRAALQRIEAAEDADARLRLIAREALSPPPGEASAPGYWLSPAVIHQLLEAANRHGRERITLGVLKLPEGRPSRYISVASIELPSLRAALGTDPVTVLVCEACGSVCDPLEAEPGAVCGDDDGPDRPACDGRLQLERR